MKLEKEAAQAAEKGVAPSQGRELKQLGEQPVDFKPMVAPSQGRELKPPEADDIQVCIHVAPSQGRELKLELGYDDLMKIFGRPFTGA